MTEEYEIVSIDTPLETVRDIFNYFHETTNCVAPRKYWLADNTATA